MATTTFLPAVNTKANTHNNIFTAFFNWCAKQEDKRLMWTAIAIPAQACVLAPVTLVLALLSGVHFIMLVPVILAIVMTLVTNLAALPTKITIPTFFIGALIDLAVIIGAFATGVDFARLF